jgi:hypothetical protein
LALSSVADLGRVFRQVHRVLRADAPIVVSLPHPVSATLDSDAGRRPEDARLVRTYGEPATGERLTTQPAQVTSSQRTSTQRTSSQRAPGQSPPSQAPTSQITFNHTIEVLVTALTRAGFRLDTLLELMARPPGSPSAHWQPAMERLPAVLVVRARKTGL